MQYLKYNTACTVTVGPFVDATDGVTPETGLAAGTVDSFVLVTHDGTSATDISGTVTFTHITGGLYYATFTPSTIGRLTLYIRDDSVCLPYTKDFQVVAANVYDSLFAASGTDYLDVNAVQWAGTATSLNGTTSLPEVDVKAVSGDATAANNLELDYDGTGYDKTASYIQLDADTMNAIADHVIRRGLKNVEDSSDGDTLSFRSPYGAMCRLVNKWYIDGTTLYITKTDDTSQIGSQTVATDSSVDPATSMDTVGGQTA